VWILISSSSGISPVSSQAGEKITKLDMDQCDELGTAEKMSELTPFGFEDGFGQGIDNLLQALGKFQVPKITGSLCSSINVAFEILGRDLLNFRVKDGGLWIERS